MISKEKLEIWANHLVNHSLGKLCDKDVVMIKGESVCWPLISILQDKIFQAGAIADVNIIAPDNNRGGVWSSSAVKFGNRNIMKQIPEWHLERYKNMTKYIEIMGNEDPSLFSSLSEEQSQFQAFADSPCRALRFSKDWLLTLYPTQSFADMEGMSLEEYSKIILDASTADHSIFDELEEPIAQLIDKGNLIRIESIFPNENRNLVLELDISERMSVKCTGTRNFPDGEVYTSPNAGKVEGEIFVDLPVYYNGNVIEGIYLKFNKGEIVKYSANRGEQTLRNIIESDYGSHRLGEVAFGMNQGLKKALLHPLLVEKVGGTMHIAIGSSYPNPYVGDVENKEEALKKFKESGDYNSSSQHVDIVCDFREGGCGKKVFIDDTQLFVKNRIWEIG